MRNPQPEARQAAEMTLQLHGAGSPTILGIDLQGIEGVLEVHASESGDSGD